MEQWSSNNLSDSVTGHVVQAGAVHGDIVFNAESDARIAHARTLREERLSTYTSFLDATESLAEQFQKTAGLSQEFIRPKVFDVRDLWMLHAHLEQDKISLEKLRPLTHAVQMIGPESTYDAARSVSAGFVALLISSEIVYKKRANVPRRWQRNHEFWQEGLHERISKFRDEIRRVRETPPA